MCMCMWSVRETENRVCREFAAVLMAVDDGQRACIYTYIQNTLFHRLLPIPPKFNWPVDDKNLSMPINRQGVTLEVYTKYCTLYYNMAI